jgi:hypothetical protein
MTNLHIETLTRITFADPPLCTCLTYIGDNGDCPIHGKAPKSLPHAEPVVVQFERQPDEGLL